MSEKLYRNLLIAIAAGFSAYFVVVVGPALLQDMDIVGGLAAGFVNPYAAGYSGDIFFCYAALLVWVVYEAKVYQVKNGWICLVVGAVPGVAVGFALYLVLRHTQIQQKSRT